jgi:hypothetical protein
MFGNLCIKLTRHMPSDARGWVRSHRRSVRFAGMNLPAREAKVARRISDLSEQFIEEPTEEAFFPQGPDQFREAISEPR